MARIRTIKPEFFRHEGLQDLEKANSGKHIMLVFAGLWGHCDKHGKFEWKPRTLKLDILPFLEFDMTETLELLRAAGQIDKYAANGQDYGLISSFAEHQRITGKESENGGKFPDPPQLFPGETPGKHPDAQEGKGREGKGRGATSFPCPHDQIIAVYHAELPDLPKVRQWSEARKGRLNARWKEVAERQSVEWWREFFAYVREKCPFLVGKVPGQNGRPPFEADLEWLVTEGNFVKVIEGKYEQKGRA